MASSQKLEDQHIFSEFEDEERKALIGELVRSNRWLFEVPRVSLFALWFSDINVPRKAADPKAYPGFSTALALTASAIPDYDIPGICMYTQGDVSDSKLTFSTLVRLEAGCKQANQAHERMVQEPNSQTGFHDEEPREQA